MKSPSSLRPFFISAVFFILYALTAQRGVSWQDSGVYQLRIVYRDLCGVAGLSSAHPLYIGAAHFFAGILGRVFSIEAPQAANLMSAFWAAAALGVFHAAARRFSKSAAAATAATVTLGLAHMTWWLATIAESYTMSLCLIACETLCVLRLLENKTTVQVATGALGAALFAGAGFSVHNLSLLSLPLTGAVLFYAIFVREVSGLGKGSLLNRVFYGGIALYVLVFAWGTGANFVLKLMNDEINAGIPDGSAVCNLLFGHYAPEVLGLSRIPFKLTLANLALAALSFASPCFLVALIDLPRRFRAFKLRRLSPSSIYVLALFIVHAAFFLHYRIADQAMFVLPTLFFAALLLSKLLARRTGLRLLAVATAACSILLPVAANAVLHVPAAQTRILAARTRLLPFRDEIRYWILPWKHDECSAENFARKAIAQMDESCGVLYADTTSAPPIQLRFAEREKDWKLFTPWNDVSGFSAAAKAGHNAFAVSPVPGYCPPEALDTGHVKRLFE